MKPVLLAVAALCVGAGHAEDLTVVKGLTTLTLPDVLPMRCHLADLDATASVRWQGKNPVTFYVWSVLGHDTVQADLAVYDEAGKEVPMWHLLSSWRPPYNSGRILAPGQTLTLQLRCEGEIEFTREGRYYAVARIISSIDGEGVAVFETQRCWFRVGGGDRESAHPSPTDRDRFRPTST